MGFRIIAVRRIALASSSNVKDRLARDKPRSSICNLEISLRSTRMSSSSSSGPCIVDLGSAEEELALVSIRICYDLVIENSITVRFYVTLRLRGQRLTVLYFMVKTFPDNHLQYIDGWGTVKLF